MTTNTKTFASPQDVASAFADYLVQLAEKSKAEGTTASVCLSGGSTPKRLFKTLARQHADVDWSAIHFFWGDERCVPAESDQSNYGEAWRLFLSTARGVSSDNVHAVNETADPQAAAQQYQQQILQIVGSQAGQTPVFDLMVLGMGDDGHTASIFPDRLELLDSDEVCDVATHPTSGQQRVTVTGTVIAASRQIFFLVTGQNKAGVLSSIVNRTGDCESYPTSRFAHLAQTTFWLDEAAASQLASAGYNRYG